MDCVRKAGVGMQTVSSHTICIAASVTRIITVATVPDDGPIRGEAFCSDCLTTYHMLTCSLRASMNVTWYGKGARHKHIHKQEGRRKGQSSRGFQTETRQARKCIKMGRTNKRCMHKRASTKDRSNAQELTYSTLQVISILIVTSQASRQMSCAEEGECRPGEGSHRGGG